MVLAQRTQIMCEFSFCRRKVLCTSFLYELLFYDCRYVVTCLIHLFSPVIVLSFHILQISLKPFNVFLNKFLNFCKNQECQYALKCFLCILSLYTIYYTLSWNLNTYNHDLVFDRINNSSNLKYSTHTEFWIYRTISLSTFINFVKA